jgi:GNAT superfamily N-acetyltransferase
MMYVIDDLVIRQAATDDTGAILGCLASAFEPYRAQYTPPAFADTVLTESTLQLRMKQMHVLVATVSGHLVGTVAGACQGEDAHLRGMAVLPECRGLGVAVRLLGEIEEWTRAQGCRRITLDTTLPLQAAIRFYEKNGYSRSGTIYDFFGMPLIEYFKNLV